MKPRETEPSRVEPRRVLVIGYGNPLRGDDALGRVIAEHMLGSPRPEGIDVIVTHQLTPELAEPISRADLVIFADAAVGLPPGRMRIVPIVSETAATQSFAHHCGPERLLAAAQRLYGHRPEAWSISVGGAKWDLGARLSREVEMIVPALMHHIELLIAARVAHREAEHA
jgi:hydrogenase maturation protease